MPDPPLVGIVAVSHSRVLADAAVLLAREMLHGREPLIAVAAGLDETTLGTDAAQIAVALEQVDAGGGVVVLMDLGSAVLSAELALELLPDPAAATRVLLCPAPFVEGLVVAVVAAAAGASREEVAAEAEAALDGKRSQLAVAEAPPDLGRRPAATDKTGGLTGRFVVLNRHGLHVRPAARLVGEVRAFDAVVQLRNLTTGVGPVAAVSLSKLATLGAAAGSEIEVSATGPAAAAALRAVLALAHRQFDEAEGATQSQPDPGQPPLALPSGLRGASPGIAIGPACHLRPLPIELPVERLPGLPVEHDIQVETGRLTAALDAVRSRLHGLRAAPGSEADGIFTAHLLLLEDPALLDPVRAGIAAGRPATAAWAAAVHAVVGEVQQLDDPYLRARAADLQAVSDQVLRSLTGQHGVTATGEGVLIARDLTPAETAELDLALVRGLVLAVGSPTSHAAILARARGLPAVVGAGPRALDISEGTLIIVDGTTGELVVDPAAEIVADYRARASALAGRRATQLAGAAGPASTRDGAAVVVAANLGSLSDARAAAQAGAEEAGLVRTEFLFLGRDRAPDVDEQVADYLALAEAMAGRRLTFRTLDVGGDKPLPYVPMAAEDNPFLGIRGIRLALARPRLLHDQLVALCRVARQTPVSIMFPMVSTLDELLQARRALDAAAGGRLPAGLEVGIMVEVPAVALKAAAFLPYLDFLSIGTNDLTQYALAADRGNDAVAPLFDTLDPGVLGLVGEVCAAARGRASVAVCGEAAADPLAVPVLLGLGVRELSVSPPSVPAVKAGVRELRLTDCTALARHARAMGTAGEVRQAAAGLLAAVDRDGA